MGDVRNYIGRHYILILLPFPAGTTLLYFGAVRGLLDRPRPLEQDLPFEQARGNFYAAARHGLAAEVRWLGRRRVTLAALLREEILPLARRGLRHLGLDGAEIDGWLGIIDGRLRSGRTGAAWQRAWRERHGGSLEALTLAYLERQASGLPVHEWGL